LEKYSGGVYVPSGLSPLIPVKDYSLTSAADSGCTVYAQIRDDGSLAVFTYDLQKKEGISRIGRLFPDHRPPPKTLGQVMDEHPQHCLGLRDDEFFPGSRYDKDPEWTRWAQGLAVETVQHRWAADDEWSEVYVFLFDYDPQNEQEAEPIAILDPPTSEREVE
jgi:hypothetical protein